MAISKETKDTQKASNLRNLLILRTPLNEITYDPSQSSVTRWKQQTDVPLLLGKTEGGYFELVIGVSDDLDKNRQIASCAKYIVECFENCRARSDLIILASFHRGGCFIKELVKTVHQPMDWHEEPNLYRLIEENS